MGGLYGIDDVVVADCVKLAAPGVGAPRRRRLGAPGVALMLFFWLEILVNIVESAVLDQNTHGGLTA